MNREMYKTVIDVIDGVQDMKQYIYSLEDEITDYRAAINDLLDIIKDIDESGIMRQEAVNYINEKYFTQREDD